MSQQPLRTRIVASISWLVYESGLASLYATDHSAWLIIAARSCRMFAFGGVSLIMAMFFSSLGFTDTQIGLFMTLTLAGDVALSFFVTLVADNLGRRRVLLAGGILMTLSGAVFTYFENFWILLFAAVVGVVSATGGDFGPFRAIEESVLSHLTNPNTRSDVLSWYITASGLGSAAGIEFIGRVVETLKIREGWSEIRVYHTVFWIYVLMGFMTIGLSFSLSDRCEIIQVTPVANAIDDQAELAEGLIDSEDEEDGGNGRRFAAQTTPKLAIEPVQKKGRLSQISAATRSVMYKLWFLLTVDSLADGMVSYALTSYYIDRKFHLSKSKLGDFMSANHILASIFTIFAGPLARHIGLINTMVFTHIPSSAAVLLFPAPSGLILTIILLFVRGSLNNMDQAPRAAFIAAIVKPEERTAVMGITAMLRTLASTIGPSITGGLAEQNKFWIAFVAAGTLRLMYDFGLWALFVNMRLHTNEGNETKGSELRDNRQRRASSESEEGEEVEMR